MVGDLFAGRSAPKIVRKVYEITYEANDMETPTLRLVDCIVYTVPESEFSTAIQNYEEVLGFEKQWERDGQAGFAPTGHEDGVAEVVLSTDTDIPQGLVHYLVDNVSEAIEHFSEQGYDVTDGPVETPVGQTATIENEWGQAFDIMDFGAD